MSSLDFDASKVFVAKAQRVAEFAVKRLSVPKTRSELMDQAAIIRRRVHTGSDKVLKSLGFSHAGIARYFQEEFGLTDSEAELLATATVELVERHGA